MLHRREGLNKKWGGSELENVFDSGPNKCELHCTKQGTKCSGVASTVTMFRQYRTFHATPKFLRDELGVADRVG